MHLAYSHPLNEHCAQHCSFHSLLHKRQCISAMFSSNKISHKLLQHTIQTKLIHSTVFTIKTDYTCHAHYSSYLEAIHNVTHSPCTSTCTPNPTLLIPHCLHNYCTQLANIKHSWQNSTRCGDGMKLLWCHSHLVWLVFEGYILTCACFRSENFFVTCSAYMHYRVVNASNLTTVIIA